MLNSFLFFEVLKPFEIVTYIQVELAHGGRGNSSSYDRSNSGHNGGRNHKFGAPKRTEYRGMFDISVLA